MKKFCVKRNKRIELKEIDGSLTCVTHGEEVMCTLARCRYSLSTTLGASILGSAGSEFTDFTRISPETHPGYSGYEDFERGVRSVSQRKQTIDSKTREELIEQGMKRRRENAKLRFEGQKRRKEKETKRRIEEEKCRAFGQCIL